MVFKREVAAVDRVELNLRHVRGRLHAGTREKRVVDASGNHHLTLVCFKKLSRIGDRLPVVSDVVEEIEHDLVDARARQQGAVYRPIVGVDQRRVARPGDVLICERRPGPAWSGPRSDAPTTSPSNTPMRTKQELRRILDQYDIDHSEQGGFKGAATKLIKEAGARGMVPDEIVDRLFPDLPADDRAAIGEMLDRGEDREAKINER
jgi:hypothetical protein